MTQAYPLRWPEGWPRTKYRNVSAFQVAPEKALQDLYRDLRLLPASHVVLSSNCPTRQDGTPYRESLTQLFPDPGVALYFQFKARPMVMAQDAYVTPASNIRALGLALEAMRTIERHGGGHMMQRSFDGFAQLPPPAGSKPAELRPWRVVLDVPPEVAGLDKQFQRPIAEDRYRKLAKERHPDQGGSAEAFAELNAAIVAAREELA